MSLGLNVLGGLEIYWKGQAAAALTLRKSRALLTYLALNPGTHGRSKLAGLLWGELPEKNARRNLRHALHTLRRALAPDILESDRLSVGLNPLLPCQVDAVEFERTLQHTDQPLGIEDPHAAIQQLESAVALYRGDFLVGFDMGDCLGFNEWVTGRRAHLQIKFAEALDGLITHWIQRGAYQRALPYARRQLAQEPLSEKSHRQMMTLLALTHQRNAALTQYETCRRVLEEELGVEPLEETTALYHAIRTATFALPAAGAAERPLPDASNLPFVGREEQHAALIDAWEAAQRGVGRLTLVEGEAGVGKTRLLEEVLRYAETQGALVLRGRCYEFGGSVPYQPIAEALRAYFREAALPLSPIWLAELARLLPGLHEMHPNLPDVRRNTGAAARQRLFEAVGRLLQSLSETHTALALFLDDLHWADQASLDLLHYLIRYLHDAPIWFAGTYRVEETHLSHPLTRLRQGLSRDHRVTRVKLTPLTDASVQTLADALVGEQEAEILGDVLFRESEGNAFILVETLSALEEKGALKPKAKAHAPGEQGTLPPWTWTGGQSPQSVPLGVQDIILQRVGRLDTGAQQLLTLAAVIGQQFDAATLQTAANQNADLVEKQLDACLARRLIRVSSRERANTDTQYDFSHDKIRAVIYHTLTHEKQRQLHHRVGEALEHRFAAQIEEHVAALAYHFERAEVAEKALVYLPWAATEAAAIYANEQALDYYRRALTFCATSDENCWRILLQQADVLSLVGKYAAALEVCQQVVEAGSPNWQARAHSRLAQLHRIRRDYASARRCVEESNRLSEADDLDVAATTDQQAYALQTLGEIEQEQGNLDRAQELFEAALTIYEKTEETAGSANCYKGLGKILSTQGAYTKARERYEQALRIYEKVGDKQSASHCLRGISTTSWRLREYKTARKAALKSRDICQSIGDRQGEAACLNSLGLLAIVRGNHVETQRHLQASVAIYRDLGLEKRTASGLHNLGISYMESGKMVAARRSLEQALEIDQAVGSPHDQALDLGWLGKLHWLLKEYDAAVDYLDRALALDREIGGGEEEDWHLIWRTAVACEQDQPEEARIYLQRAERMFAQGSANLKMHDIAQWTARVYLIEGDSAAALAMAREALTAARAVEAPPATLAEILTLLGRTLGADVGSNCEEAGAHFEQALALLPDATPTAYLRATTLYHYGNHLASNGNKDQADAHCEEARAIFKRIGVPLEFMQ